MLLSALEIVKNSYFLCKQNWRRLLVYALFIFLPTLILTILGILSIYLTAYLPALTLTTNLIILAIFTANLVFTLWTTIALSKEVQNILQNSPALGWKNNYTATSHLIWPMVYTSILVGLIVFFGTLLLIIPGIIFLVWYFFIFYAVAFENKTGLNALRSSKDLVVGRWWAMAWRMFLPTLIFGLSASILQYVIITIPTYLLQSTIIIGIINTLIGSVINSLLTPLILTSGIILFFNAKANRTEKPTTITTENR